VARAKKPPCIDVELDVRTDERFEVLGSIAGYNRHEALGRIFNLWAWCTERARERLRKKLPWEPPIAPAAVVVHFLGPKGVDAILGGGVDEFALGELQADGRIYVRGTHRSNWGHELADGSRAGGEARASAPRDLDGRFVSGPTVVQRDGTDHGTSAPPDGYIASTPPVQASQRTPASSLFPLPSSPEESELPLSRARARAIPPSPVPAPVLAPLTDTDTDRWCTDRWGEVNAHRARIAAANGLEHRSLHPQDDGRKELALRMRDGYSRDDIAHVIRVVVDEAEDAKSLRWLDGGMFKKHRVDQAMARTIGDARRSRAGPHGGRDTRSVFDVVDETTEEIKRKTARGDQS
jgi:hypothetical protein